MRWFCKCCSFSSPNRRTLITHHKLKHCTQARHFPLPCLYADCVCSFRTESSLRKHLARDHSCSSSENPATLNLICELCCFSETCTITEYFAHLKKHLNHKETVKCPFIDCDFQSNVYSTFRAHKCKKHQQCSVEKFRSNLHRNCALVNVGFQNELQIESDSHALTTEEPLNDQDLSDLLQHQFASLLLRMQTILHVSKATTQEIINELTNLNLVLEEFTPKLIENVITKHNCVVNSSVTAAITEIVKKANPLSFLSRNGPFCSDYKRTTYYKTHFKVIEAVEYILDAHLHRKFAYIPILKVLSELLNRNDVLDKIIEAEHSRTKGHYCQYKTYRDSSYYKDNTFFTSKDLRIALGLYIDEFETCNSLGTSKKIHKVCAVYWVLSNLPLDCRSSVQSIYLACLCHSSDVKKHGYDAVLQPLIKDLQILEQQGVVGLSAVRPSTGTEKMELNTF
nr:uncharacterized protein LOC129166763 [Nothobranchius furzeri]